MPCFHYQTQKPAIPQYSPTQCKSNIRVWVTFKSLTSDLTNFFYHSAHIQSLKWFKKVFRSSAAIIYESLTSHPWVTHESPVSHSRVTCESLASCQRITCESPASCLWDSSKNSCYWIHFLIVRDNFSFSTSTVLPFSNHYLLNSSGT